MDRDITSQLDDEYSYGNGLTESRSTCGKGCTVPCYGTLVRHAGKPHYLTTPSTFGYIHRVLWSLGSTILKMRGYDEATLQLREKP